MTNIVNLSPYLESVRERIEGDTLPSSDLKSGGGDGTSGGMEARIKNLEVSMVDVKTTLARMEERMAHLATSEQVSRIEGKLDGKVSWPWMLGLIVGQVATIAAVVFTGARILAAIG